MRQNRRLCQTHKAPPTSAPWRVAHVGERRAVAGVDTNGEQIASEQATGRGYDSCCTVLLLFHSLLHYKSVLSGFLSIWVGLYFQERGFTKIRPPPSLRSHLSSSPMVIFSSAYGKFIQIANQGLPKGPADYRPLPRLSSWNHCHHGVASMTQWKCTEVQNSPMLASGAK